MSIVRPLNPKLAAASVIFALLALPALPMPSNAQLDQQATQRVADRLIDEATRYLQEFHSQVPQPQGELVALAGPSSQFATSASPVVRCMPGSVAPFGEVLAYAWPNRELILWGRVDGGAAPYQYEWDFGDGSPIVSGTVADANYIDVFHFYANAGGGSGPRNSYVATLTVTDANGEASSCEVEIDVETFDSPEKEQNLRTNAAIQDGLRWLYLHQNDNGSWDNNPATTAAAVAAFELQGHLPDLDTDDVYAEFVRAGLEFLFSTLCKFDFTATTPAGDPDTEPNGFGLYSCASTHQANSAYTQGLMMLALAVSRRPGHTAMSGRAEVAGRTYKEILTDMVDQLAYSQTETPASRRGGWRYAVNTHNSDSDNSAVQWAAIGLQAAEATTNLFNISVPAFVKDELDVWLQTSQCSDGGFGYTARNSWCNNAKTGSGLFSVLYVEDHQRGQPVSPRAQNAIDFIDTHWCDTSDTNNWHEQFNGNFYAMYAVKKPFDDHGIELPGRNWNADFRSHLVQGLATPCGSGAYEQITDTGDRLNDGRWPNDYMVFANNQRLGLFNWGGPSMPTSFALLILIPGASECGIVCRDAVAIPDSTCPEVPVDFDASATFTTCADRELVAWEWDFDGDGVVDANGQEVTYDAGFPAEGTFFVNLRATDSEGDAAECQIPVVVTASNVCPVACLDGPFTACVGDTIRLDACCSFDPNEPGRGGACPDLGDSIAEYRWDLDGDTIVDLTTSTCAPDTFLVFFEETQRRVTMRAVDTFGCVSDATATLVWSARQDLSIAETDISANPEKPQVSQDCAVTIQATVHAEVQGGAPSISAAIVEVYYDKLEPLNLICRRQIVDLGDGDSATIECVWALPDTIPHDIIVVADPGPDPSKPGGLIRECVEFDNIASTEVQCITNRAPVCSLATPSVSEIWPPNHKFVEVDILGVFDPDSSDTVTIKITGITQDEPVNTVGDGHTSFDAQGLGTARAMLRAERTGNPNVPGNGRVYEITFEASDGKDTCTGSVKVCVPHDRSPRSTCIDDGQNYNSTGEMQASETDPGFLSDLEQFPNPFNPNTTIRYRLPSWSHVNLTIYNAAGRAVRSLVNEAQPAGIRSVVWDGRDSSGREVASGIYIYRLRAGTIDETRRMILLK